MNWFGNGSSAHLWTIGLGVAAVLAVVSAIAYYVYSRRHREVEEQIDLAREQRIKERLAQIAAMPPLPVVEQRQVVEEQPVVEECQVILEQQLVEERQTA